jgi:hypothetical protein
MLRYLMPAVVILAHTAVSAAPLLPTGPWHLYYLPSSCAAERPFGDHILGFERAPLGDTTRLIIIGPGRSTESRQLDSLIELSDGGAPIKSSSIVYGTSKKDRRGITTIVASGDAQRVSESKWLRLSTLGTEPASKRSTPSRKPIFSAEFNVGSTVALAKELTKCMDDLRRHWGMVDGELPKPAQLAANADQAGSTKFLLMIDESGAVIDCLVSETSKVASLDAMGCQVMRARVRAKPALDSAGKPVKSIYVQTVNWQLSW